MDWSRAKTILIVIFLLLNIFLIATIAYTNTDLRFQSDYAQHVREYLKSRSIEVQTKLPSTPVITAKAGIINYSDREYDLEALCLMVFGHKVIENAQEGSIDFTEGDESIVLKDDELIIRDRLTDGASMVKNPNKMALGISAYLKNLGFPGDSLSLQVTKALEVRKASYILKYRNAFLFDQVITAELDDDGVLSLCVKVREPKYTNKPEMDELLSAYQVLVMGNLPYGSKITGFDFGYKRVGQDDLYDSPVWRVALGDGTTIFYNAHTGEKLQ